MIGHYPQAVMVKKPDGTGFGFFFSSLDDFNASAEAFLKPINATITKRLKDAAGKAPLETGDMQLAAALSFLSQYLDGTLDEVFSADSIRWIAAAGVRAIFGSQPFPSVLVIEDDAGKVEVREGDEFLNDPGYPLAVVVGRPDEGGGTAQFFSAAKDYEAVGASEPTEKVWLPQILFRLYKRTPAVMTGVPTRAQNSERVGMECRGLSFCGTAEAVER